MRASNTIKKGAGASYRGGVDDWHITKHAKYYPKFLRIVQ
jgi:hypothetical protein